MIRFGHRWFVSIVSIVAVAAVVMSLVVGARPTSASPSDPDPSFGDNGWVRFGELTRPEENVTRMVVQPDGKIVVVGCVISPGGPGGCPQRGPTRSDLAVWRFLPDGTLDPGFGRDGRVVPAVEDRRSAATDVLIQSGGTIVIAGYVGGRAAVLRLTSAGVPDASFGRGDGLVTLRGGPGWIDRIELDALPDGGLVLGATWYDRTEGRYGRSSSVLIALTDDGTRDETFGDAGTTWMPRPQSSLVASDLGIVTATTGRGGHFVISRLGLDGTPDITFGGDGRRRYAACASCEYSSFGGVSDVAIDATGRVVVAYYGEFYLSDLEYSLGWGVARVLPSGEPDPSFGDEGVRHLMGGFITFPRALSIQADGAMVVSGASGIHGGSGEHWPAVARLTADGDLDETWGDGGVAQVPADGDEYLWAYAVDHAVAGDGDVLLLCESPYAPGSVLGRLSAS